jgi:hypothetical protein
LNERQIKLLMAFCANGIQHEKDPDLRVKKIVELRGRLEETVPNWMQLIEEVLSDGTRPEASEALATYKKLAPAEQYPPPRSPLIFKAELAPFYRPLDEVERNCKELNARRVDYALAMSIVDELYMRGGLDDEDYQFCRRSVRCFLWLSKGKINILLGRPSGEKKEIRGQQVTAAKAPNNQSIHKA